MMMKLNVKLLKKVKRAMLKHPENTNMSHWVVHEDGTAPCGTAGCIAGWVVAEASIRKLRNIPAERTVSWSLRFQEKARKLLRITEHQGDMLFKLDYWPGNLRDRYYGARSRKRSAKLIAERIDEFIQAEET
jgi:hypothetical protein